jgi:hypothetical protein
LPFAKANNIHVPLLQVSQVDKTFRDGQNKTNIWKPETWRRAASVRRGSSGFSARLVRPVNKHVVPMVSSKVSTKKQFRLSPFPQHLTAATVNTKTRSTRVEKSIRTPFDPTGIEIDICNGIQRYPKYK